MITPASKVHSVADVQMTLIIAFVLVVIVIFAFLGRVTDTLIPVVALPLSLLITFIAMRMLGYSLDNLSLMALTLAIGLYRVGETGPMWPDDPRYANAGAMVHDWLRSGEWLHPYAFAQRNYAQYPGFSVPYHPPGYPGMLGVYFLLTGVGHVAARMFVHHVPGWGGWMY